MNRLAGGFFLGLGLTLAGALAAQPPNVLVESPDPAQPVFGPTEVRVRVQAGEPVDRVELFVNGRLMGVDKAPPYNFTVDVGEDNVEREFRAVAHTASGSMGRASVVTQPVRIDDVMTFTLRPLFVTVNRAGGRDLTLEQNDFQIFDNGVRQEIVTFGRDELPLTAVLLLDTSESMKGDRLEGVRRGARAFIDGMQPQDEASIALFSDGLLHFAPFTEDKGALGGSLAGVQAAGGTSVSDFLYLSLKLLESRPGQRVVVLFSDGADVHSVVPAADVLWKARTGQALIYWIQLGEEKRKSFTSAWRSAAANDREYEGLERAVGESGGRVLRIARTDELEGAFRQILRELREQYALGYYPSNSKGDGAWHKVDVRVRGGARARTREGYVDN